MQFFESVPQARYQYPRHPIQGGVLKAGNTSGRSAHQAAGEGLHEAVTEVPRGQQEHISVSRSASAHQAAGTDKRELSPKDTGDPSRAK